MPEAVAVAVPSTNTPPLLWRTPPEEPVWPAPPLGRRGLWDLRQRKDRCWARPINLSGPILYNVLRPDRNPGADYGSGYFRCRNVGRGTFR